MEYYEASAAVYDEILSRIQLLFGGTFTAKRVRTVFEERYDE
jgi:hypothetical protein